METVPSLCASGTVAVAAVGLAFGRPQHSIAARPTSNKRRATSQVGPDDARFQATMPTTPSPLPSSTSASTSRLRKRASAGRPLSSTSNPRGGARTVGTTPNGQVIQEDDGTDAVQPTLHGQQSRQSMGSSSFTFEYPGSERIRPSWLHRKSNLSSLKSDSPATTDRPGSASIAYSNGSAAPILPSENSPSTPSRNKLVKRSSSQRALHGSGGMHSTLRRPATSHQRSATLQRQYMDEDQVGQRSSFQRSSFTPSIFNQERTEPLESYDDSMQVWRPFFRPNAGKSGSSRKRNALGGTSKEDSLKTIVPDITELSTLVMATSISTRVSHETFGRASTISALSRPFTPVGWPTQETPSSSEKETTAQTEPKPRTSFSISDMFPSPSPSTWKMPRTGSLRNKKSFARTGGRRVASAPMSSKTRNIATNTPASNGFSGKPVDTEMTNPGASPLAIRSGPINAYQRPPNSPLPPLNRLSAFEVNLPETVPSYPTSPLLEDLPNMPRNFSSVSSPSLSSQRALSAARNQPRYPSGAHSDHTSTLFGSDADNSRLMSGDEGDMDARSETVFDSTRTGATGNSLSGLKRPPIDTIFDESPSPETRPHDETLALKKPLAYVGTQIARPVLIDHLRKEDESPTGVQQHSRAAQASQIESSPPSGPLKLSSALHPSDDAMLDKDDDHMWSLDYSDNEQRVNMDSDDTNMTSESHLAAYSSRSREVTPRRRDSPPADADRSSKSNIFEWSEHLDNETSPGGSPRPKTVHGRQGNDIRGSRVNGRRGPSALHLRSQSVPVPHENRTHNNPAKLESWMLGNKGPSEDWGDDFDFGEASLEVSKQQSGPSNEPMRASLSSGMLVPQAILERQASVHGQFVHVKELSLLVEELKRLQQQATVLDIMNGQSIELWKEAEGIINLATLNDDEEDLFPPHSPRSPGGFDFDAFDDDSPSNRKQRSGFSPPLEDRLSTIDDTSTQASSRPSQEISSVQTPPMSSRPRKESSAKAKHVLESIHQQRTSYDPALLDAGIVQKKLPFDTTSLKDLVTRAGVVTRALKEIVRRAEGVPPTPEPQPSSTPKDPPFSQIFQQPPPSPTLGKAPRASPSPKSPKSPRSPRSPKGSPYKSGSIAGNDNEINGHMKMMTVV